MMKANSKLNNFLIIISIISCHKNSCNEFNITSIA